MRKYSYCGSCFNEALRWAASFVVSRIRKTAALSGNFDCSTNCRNPAQFSPIYSSSISWASICFRSTKRCFICSARCSANEALKVAVPIGDELPAMTSFSRRIVESDRNESTNFIIRFMLEALPSYSRLKIYCPEGKKNSNSDTFCTITLSFAYFTGDSGVITRSV